MFKYKGWEIEIKDEKGYKRWMKRWSRCSKCVVWISEYGDICSLFEELRGYYDVVKEDDGGD